MSKKVTRRGILQATAVAAGTTAAVEAQQSAHQHPVNAPPKAAGPYKPKVFNAQEFATMQRLAEVILPADEKSPSAKQAGAAEYIDYLCNGNQQLRDTFLGGLGWLNSASLKRNGKVFVEATPEQQTALLDLIAYRKNMSPELAPGIRFFEWARRMVVDAFYTSPHGVKDIEYKGNRGMTDFKVPQAAIEYAVKRSPFASEG